MISVAFSLINNRIFETRIKPLLSCLGYILSYNIEFFKKKKRIWNEIIAILNKIKASKLLLSSVHFHL